MEKRRPKAGTVVMIALLLALTGVCVYLAPRTRDAYQEYRTESEATPTPTADNANMMAVTLDPNATPTPTMLILKLGTQGDEVKKLQERLYQLGYYTGEIDGQYGQGTAQAVIAFQNSARHRRRRSGRRGDPKPVVFRPGGDVPSHAHPHGNALGAHHGRSE